MKKTPTETQTLRARWL